jgi:hypothetical protein
VTKPEDMLLKILLITELLLAFVGGLVIGAALHLFGVW